MLYFNKGKNATETQKKIGAVCGEGAVTDHTHQEWFIVGLSDALEDV